ncbi:MAG TPA: hypothetical protein VIU63_08350 [Nitrospira sp.]
MRALNNNREDAMSAAITTMKQMSRYGLLFILTMNGATVSFGAARDAAPAVGYIEQLAGDLEAFSIERAGRTVPLALLLPVRTGDRVFVQGQGNLVLLQCGNRRIRITERESPFVVPVVASPPSFVTRLGALLLDLGNRMTMQQAKSVTKVSTSSRGEDGTLAIPLLQDRNSYLAADVTALSVAWKGGVAPYRVRISAGLLDTIGAQEHVDTTRIVIPLSEPLSAGFFHVEVIDGEGSRVQGTFEAIPPSRLPAIEPSLRHSDIPTSLRTVLVTDALVKKSPHEWSFQAYQQIAPIAEEFEPARLLRDCLESAVSCYDR